MSSICITLVGPIELIYSLISIDFLPVGQQFAAVIIKPPKNLLYNLGPVFSYRSSASSPLRNIVSSPDAA